MTKRIFVRVWEDLSKPWAYFITDFDSLEEAQEDVRMMQEQGDLRENALIRYYEAELMEV